MEMSTSEIFKTAALVLVPIGLAVVSYIVGAMKMLNNANRLTAEEIAKHRLHVAEKYVPRDELADALKTIRAESEAMEDRLEKRFDKMESWMGRRFDMLLGRITPTHE